MTRHFFAVLSICLFTQALLAGINDDKKRAEEIRNLMWNSADPDFTNTSVPQKWASNSAVILARAFFLSYRKLPIVTDLSHENYAHYRVKLQDSKGLEEYAQFTLTGSGSWGNVRSYSYAGFKIIKPDGSEVEIPLSLAVKENQELNRTRIDVYKLAIPNLEQGDILDYYIVEEQIISVNAKYYTFDPEIFLLQTKFPILKQKISFDVLRRCFINAKSINGAPELKLREDAEKEKNQYLLEDGNRESIQATQWVFPYREIPTLKFKVTYASSMVAAQIPGFLEEPGVIKSQVRKSEVKDLMAAIYTYPSIHATLLRSTMDKQYKGIKDQNKLAREAFYTLRHQLYIKYAAEQLASGYEPKKISAVEWTKALSSYYRTKKINHEIIIGIPRQISSLDNLIMENELTVMIRVNTSKPFYIGTFDIHSVIDEIDPDLQGEEVYVANALGAPSLWRLESSKIPITPHQENSSEGKYSIRITDLSEGLIEATLQKSYNGASRNQFQNTLLDFHDYRDEEKERFNMTEKKPAQSKNAKRLLSQREDYLSRRDELKKESLKNIITNEFDLEIKDVDKLKILSTGRFDKSEAFSYSCQATFKGALRKVGTNYIFDIGKFIENQIQLSEEDRTRKYNVYMPFARSFRYTLEIIVPQGLKAEGLENLNMKVENQTGGFISQVTESEGKINIEVHKYYTSNFEKSENWNNLVEFLDAAYSFSQKQILLKAML
jgi:hypothetical protein